MWQADPGELAQIREIFRATLSRDPAERSSALEFLAHARAQPQFENYLCQLLVHDADAPPEIRAAAGISLKNSVAKDPARAREDVKGAVLDGLLSPHTIVRNITGNVVTSLFAAEGTLRWPEAVPRLLQVSEAAASPAATREAAVSALAKICEDSAASLDVEVGGERPLDHLCARLLALSEPQNGAAPPATAKLRAAAVHCLNQLLPLKAQSVAAFLDRYLEALFAMARDPSAEVRKNVCAAFAGILETRPDRLLPHIEGVVSYCVHQMRDADEAVAMEACEFLLALSERPDDAYKHVFRAQVGAVVPVLLEKMVYSDEQIVLIELVDARDSAASAGADRREDVRPNVARAKDSHTVSGQKPAYTSDSEGDSDSDSEGDSDDELDDELDSWNVRRCAAASLDAVSLNHPQAVVAASLPILQERIVSTEWPVREAAILAFGAIAAACTQHAQEQLAVLVPFLVQRTKDPEPRVRQISCWTLSRYAEWICRSGNEQEGHAVEQAGHSAPLFAATFETVVHMTMDPQKLVQQAACSALALFVETAEVASMEPYIGPLFEHFARCVASYQRRNLLVLYDCVATFVDRIGPAVFGSQPQYARVLLPPLLHNWQALADDDTDLWPLLECMSVVAAAMGESFAPFAVPVYERALAILGNAVRLNQEVHTNPLIEAPEKDFMVASLDLIDGLVQGFKEHSVDLMQQHGANVSALVVACLEDHCEDVRQSAYALLGDLAIFACDAAVAPYLREIVLCVGSEVSNYSYATHPVANNAIWALGEIALKVPPAAFAPHVANVAALLVPLLTSSDTQQTVLENAAICLGRLGSVGGAPVLAPRLPEFFYAWCAQIMYVVENDEKESAFFGMIATLQASPDAGLGGLVTPQGRKNLAVFVSCIGNYFNPSDSLKELFFQTLASYKEAVGDAWHRDVMPLVDDESRSFVQSIYNV